MVPVQYGLRERFAPRPRVVRMAVLSAPGASPPAPFEINRMQITLPAHVLTGAAPTSVLQLEPLLELLRQCRPDSVSLMPPPGPDDLPNGPALLAMKDRLSRAGVGVVPGSWQVAPQADVNSESWMTEQLFEIRALVAALGEAGVSPLVLDWDAPAERGALEEFLAPLLEEAERAGVAIALRLRGAEEVTQGLLRSFGSPWLGACCELWPLGRGERDPLRRLEALGEHVLAIRPGRCWEAHTSPTATGDLDWRRVLETLRQLRFEGPVLLDTVRSKIECGAGVGFFRGLQAGAAWSGPARSRAATLIEVV